MLEKMDNGNISKSLELVHVARIQKVGENQHFSRGFLKVSDLEYYISFGGAGTDPQTPFILATGDGGETIHTIFMDVIPSGAGIGFATPPCITNEGKIISVYNDNTGRGNLIFDKPQWVSDSIDYGISNEVVPVSKNVEEVFFFNSLTITTTTAQFSPTLDLSKYRSFIILASSNLNQPVGLGIQPDEAYAQYWNGSAWVNASTTDIILPVGASGKYILNTKWLFLNNNGLKNVRMIALCSTAPTNGSLTVKVLGVPN